MINIIHKLVSNLSDEELDYLGRVCYKESEKRAQEKRAKFGSDLPPLDTVEKAYADNNQVIEAIKHFRIRSGCSLKAAKDHVEDYLRSLGKM
jgi:ribosomal protein L7/L12